MQIDWDKVLPIVLTTWLLVKKWTAEIDKILTPLIAEVERMAQDGKIDRSERKQIVLTAIKNLEKDGKLKLSGLQRIFLGWGVDWIARKLPDFNVSITARDTLNELVK